MSALSPEAEHAHRRHHTDKSAEGVETPLHDWGLVLAALAKPRPDYEGKEQNLPLLQSSANENRSLRRDAGRLHRVQSLGPACRQDARHGADGR
jgi:hypothetical protein